jgi:hypothetical protein
MTVPVIVGVIAAYHSLPNWMVTPTEWVSNRSECCAGMYFGNCRSSYSRSLKTAAEARCREPPKDDRMQSLSGWKNDNSVSLETVHDSY